MNPDKKAVELIQGLIQEGLRRHVDEEWEKRKKTFLEDLERSKAAAVAGITLDVMKAMSFRDLGDTYTIIIKK